MSRRISATTVCTILLLALALLTASSAEAAFPSKKRWVADTYRAMYGSRIFVGHRVAQQQSIDQQAGTTTRLAVNLDIDNTSLATHYQPGAPVAVTLRFVRYAKAHGLTILFNTGRLQSVTPRAVTQLRRAGYPVDGICGRTSTSEGLAHSKQRCRQQYVDAGYTIVANVGNRATDFTGANYERAYKLPSYHNQLG